MQMQEPFLAPSVDRLQLLRGQSYSYYTRKPDATSTDPETRYVLGIDEAGRGPVLGPMVYSAFYLPDHLHHTLLTRDYSFNDSKALSPAVRENLMKVLCTPGNGLFDHCGWAVKVLSARDISSGMMRPASGVYNLNAQAMDATVEIIRGVNVSEVYVDTVGNPASYQQKLERIFPSLKITVAKKADSLYPCVSAASIVAKVTRDSALDVHYDGILVSDQDGESVQGWGSGYPSDSKCVTWLQKNMHPIFGWGNECRFSWGTAKDMLELKGGTMVDWPEDDGNCNTNSMNLRAFMLTPAKTAGDDLRQWYGQKTSEVL